MRGAGVIGLGQIGGGVALCLARAGMLAAVHDVRADAGAGLDGVPPLSASPAELARACDVVIVAVVSAEQTLEVLGGPRGVLAAAHPDTIIVLLATVALDDLAEIRAITDAAGVPLIDAGVAGGPKAAEKGMILLTGAADAALARARPVLDACSRYVEHVGGPGAGMAAKIVRNVIAVGCLRAAYEGTALARAMGIDMRRLIRVMDDTSDSAVEPMMMARRPADPASDAAEAGFAASIRTMMVKDIDAALALGEATGTPLPLLELTRATSDDVARIRA